MEKYVLKKSNTRPNGWVLTDTIHRVVIIFEEGRYNETHSVTMLDDGPAEKYTPDELAAIASGMGAYLVRYHSSKCFSRPYGFEYEEGTEDLYLYRRKYPKWRVKVEPGVSAVQLANSLRKAAEFLKKGQGKDRKEGTDGNG